ncbi:DMT family transporter [Thalassobaculum litoreum]|uniref:EamA-like transporter family protein n=1 Tax=Thalassobaculum litoreum DSM 18839 TaxID=1123362 RepID=A0A8G2BEI7_9PROT|nr:DMT family transporter [Thalassobaculum litoreum]SDF18061.1 EamA-like transporter family protein [Thalassobaculum litoreum DSM 18839]
MADLYNPRVEALKGHAAMLLFATLISGSFTLGHLTAPHIDPGALTALRFALAAAVMAGAILAGRKGERQLGVRAPWRFLLLGVLLGSYFVLMFEALRLTDPVSLAAVFTMTPLMTALFGYLILRQGISLLVGGSLLLAASGAVWVVFRGDVDAMLAFDLGPGELIFLGACVCHALYIPLITVLNRGESGKLFTLWTVLGGFLVVGIYAFPAILRTDWTALPPIVWVTAVYISVFASALTFFLMRYGALRLPAAKVMAYGYLIPTVVIVLEGLSGHGWVDPPVLLGVAATMLALLMLVANRDAVR